MEVRDLSEYTLVKLATERKHLTDLIKMLAYQAESDLLNLLQPYYRRAEQEGRTLLHELFTATGDIHVTDDELRITLAPLSSPHRTRAVQSLCELLDQTATVFPGTRLRLASPCVRRHSSGSPSPAHRFTAAAPRPPDHPKPDIFQRGYIRRSELSDNRSGRLHGMCHGMQSRLKRQKK